MKTNINILSLILFFNLDLNFFEVEINKNDVELDNLGLSKAEKNDLLAILFTLTDTQYEHLIP